MNWEELTAPDFAAAAKTCGRVCAIPMGVVEKHGDHLPVGEDAILAQGIVREAAKREQFMVFPSYFFGQNTHAKCEPGAIAIDFKLLLPLLESVCDEICRNGFDKILIFNAHGGNQNLLNFFSESLLDKEKPWSLFTVYIDDLPGHAKFLEGKYDGHGGEMETSLMAAVRPELVKSLTPPDYGMPKHREKAFRDLGCHTPSWWYAIHPDMLAADQTTGTPEKGRKILESMAEKIAEIVRLIKQDDSPRRLYEEFHARCRSHR